jgi:hypothetical protein
MVMTPVSTDLSSEDVHCKPIEAADDCLLDVETQAVQSCHCGQQDAWPTRAEHVDIDCMPFPHPDLNLRPTRSVYLIQYRYYAQFSKKEVKDEEPAHITYWYYEL